MVWSVGVDVDMIDVKSIRQSAPIPTDEHRLLVVRIPLDVAENWTRLTLN
jgi:hypothetical protein